MKEFLRQQMVMTDFESEMYLKRRKGEIKMQIEKLQDELLNIEKELTELKEREP
mgnify:FL=1